MKFLFVCTGNTCRSPMAQGLAKLYLPEDSEVMSAGIHAFEGDDVSQHAVEALKEKGIDIRAHKAIRLTKEMLAGTDQVLTMTKSQEFFLADAYPEFREKIRSLGDFCGLGKEVPDPWGGSLEVYRRCAEELAKMLKAAAQVFNQ